MAGATGLKLVRKGVYEPAAYEPPTEVIDDRRLSELVEHLLSTNVEDEADEQAEEARKPAAAKRA